jgi:NAD(P)-dependent dehydrogenase (short-subunit alcohol dehydrogenase family)
LKRVVLVTGASSGIGAACLAHLASTHFQVYGGARAFALPPSFGAASTLHLDVTSDESVAAAVQTILDREGRIDAVVNNAGIALAGAIEDTPPEEALRQFEVNLFGVLRVCRAVLPAMRAQRSGYIVNIGSIAGLVAVPFQGLYSASKFALEGFTEALRYEVAPFGIHAVLVEPGDHCTALTKNRRTLESPHYGERAKQAINRMAHDEQTGPSPENVARLVHRILETKHPRLRYTCGPASERAAVWLKRLAPFALLEKVMGGHYFR